MGAHNSTEDSKDDMGDERQPDQTTFEVEYERYPVSFRAGDPPPIKTIYHSHMNWFELLDSIHKKAISHVHIVKIQWLPDLEIEFTCLPQYFEIDGNKYIDFRNILVTPSTHLKSSIENKDIRYYIKDSIFTVDGQSCEDGVLPEPFNLLVIPLGQLTKSATKI